MPHRDRAHLVTIADYAELLLRIASVERSGSYASYVAKLRREAELRAGDLSPGEQDAFAVFADLIAGRLAEELPPRLDNGCILVERSEDMSPRGFLRVIVQEDGDVVVCSVADPDEGRPGTVEFCTPGTGGGRSKHTLHALRRLAAAMHKDNLEGPIP